MKTAIKTTTAPVPLPAAAPRRVLLAVTGLSPQIVTETLYALACNSETPWLPTEVHLITTATGRREAELNLLADQKLNGELGWFHRLRVDYGLPPIRFDADCIHMLSDAAGAALDDIRTPADNERAADFITEIVRELTLDEHSELHVSIAGGRKTMGYYLGYALSLFGRPQDQLSHVLVSEPFENNREFYYPTPYRRPIAVRRGVATETHDAQQARVDLARIPFVRLREGLPERLREGKAAFSQVVAIANRGQEEPQLRIHIKSRTATMDGECIDIGKVAFALLLWLAERAKRKTPAVDWGQPEAAAEFLAVLQRIINPMSGEYTRVEEALDWRKASAIKQAKYFEPHKTRINQAIETLLGTRAAERYAIRRIKAEHGYRFDLPLLPSQIEIEP